MAVELKIGGTALSDEATSCLTYAEYIESLDESDVVLIRLDLRSGMEVEPILKVAKVGATFEVSFPDGEKPPLLVTGDLLECSYSWSRAGFWRILLRGTGPLHRLRKHQPPMVWAVPPNTALGTIAGRYGLTAEAQGVDGSPKIVLQTENDSAWIADVAEKLNYFVISSGKKLKFGRRHAKSTALKVDFANDVERVTMDVSLHEPVTKVTVTAEDYTKAAPEVMKYVASKTDLLKLSGGDDAATLAAGFGREVVIPYAGSWEPNALKARAVGEIQRLAQGLVKGRARCEKAEGALSGKLIELDGAPWPLMGPFLIRQTRRVIDDGHFFIEVDFISDSLPKVS